MIKQINILKKKLKDIDQQILQLDPDEKLPIVTSYKIIPENFIHYIEVQEILKLDKIYYSILNIVEV